MKPQSHTEGEPVEQGTRPHLNYPEGSVYQLLEASSKAHPQNISYNYFGNKKTYAAFLAQIEACAKAFKAIGVEAGDVVSLCMPNTPEALIGFYAISKIGAIANMIHPLSSEKEIQYYIHLTDSSWVLTVDLAYPKLRPLLKEDQLKKVIVVSVKDAMPLPLKWGYLLTQSPKIKIEKECHTLKWKAFIKLGKTYSKETLVKTKAEDTAVILYSGGTTGTPKGIELSHLNLNALAMQSFQACGCLQQGDSVLAIMPVFHGFGLGICIHTVQYFGGTSILLPRFSGKTFGKLLIHYKPHIIAGVPTLFEALLKSDYLENQDLSFLKCVISGGDSLSIALKKKVDGFLQEHGAAVRIREGYGLTECVTGSCLTPIDHEVEGSIGIPYPDTAYKIVKPATFEEVPYGQEGEIVLSGPTVMKGYLKDPEETERVLKIHPDGKLWLHTGDIGAMDSEGYVYFKQRLKRVIISSGYCLYPQYIENIIDAHPDVCFSCVIGIDHPYKVQVAKAFIVLKKGVKGDEKVLQSIRAHCEKNLAQYSWPYAYALREELPKTLVGKVAYHQLLEEEENGKPSIEISADPSRNI